MKSVCSRSTFFSLIIFESCELSIALLDLDEIIPNTPDDDSTDSFEDIDDVTEMGSKPPIAVIAVMKRHKKIILQLQPQQQNGSPDLFSSMSTMEESDVEDVVENVAEKVVADQINGITDLTVDRGDVLDCEEKSAIGNDDECKAVPGKTQLSPMNMLGFSLESETPCVDIAGIVAALMSPTQRNSNAGNGVESLSVDQLIHIQNECQNRIDSLLSNVQQSL